MSDSLEFQWDSRKAKSNEAKHGVSFDEAKTIFTDDNGLLMPDPDYSSEEDRFVLLGLSALTRVLVVCHCYRGEDDIIRIISARKADRKERAQYTKRLPR